jgi:hypothetical protein
MICRTFALGLKGWRGAEDGTGGFAGLQLDGRWPECPGQITPCSNSVRPKSRPKWHTRWICHRETDFTGPTQALVLASSKSVGFVLWSSAFTLTVRATGRVLSCHMSHDIDYKFVITRNAGNLQYRDTTRPCDSDTTTVHYTYERSPRNRTTSKGANVLNHAPNILLQPSPSTHYYSSDRDNKPR